MHEASAAVVRTPINPLAHGRIPKHKKEQPGVPTDKDDDEYSMSLHLLKKNLYHQQKEEDQILEAYNNCRDKNQRCCESSSNCKNTKRRCSTSARDIDDGSTTSGCPCIPDDKAVDFILISGPTGAGKTGLACSLKQHLQNNDNGYFLTCKFDQFFLQRREPFQAFVMAFTEFTNQVLERGGQAILNIRDAMNKAGIGKEEETVLIRMIPALKKILVDSAVEVDLEVPAPLSCGDNAMRRFVTVFKTFVAAISSTGHPVVLLFDGLHWADCCSLNLLRSLVTNPQENCKLVAIGTYDPKNLTSQSVLSSKLRELKVVDKVRIQNIRLRNLSEWALYSLLFQSLPRLSSQDHGKGKIFSDLVFRQTNGNRLYVFLFISWLMEEKLLQYDKVSDSWKWDELKILLSIDDERCLSDFLFDQLQNLPGNAKELLKVAACLGSGSGVDTSLLEFVLPFPVEPELKIVHSKGMLVHQKHFSNIYHFSNACFQRAAYSLIPDDKKELFHLNVARKLWNGLDANDGSSSSSMNLDKNIFILLSQLHLGIRLIQSQREKNAVAALCMHAAKRAVASSAFANASFHLNFALGLLDTKTCWRDQYELTLALHNAAAEMELVLGNPEKVNALLEVIFSNVNNFHDKIQAYSSKICVLGIHDQQHLAIDTGLDVLKQLGNQIPKKICTGCVLRETKCLRRLLRSKSDEQLLRMPVMENENVLSSMKIMNFTISRSLFARPELALFLQLQLVKMTLKHGLNVYASIAFSAFGSLCLKIGGFDDALRFGKLALKFLERFQVKAYLPRVFVAVYGCIYVCGKPDRDRIEPLLMSYRVGLQTGDIEYAFVSSAMYSITRMFSGTPLSTVHSDFTRFCREMKSNSYQAHQLFTDPFFNVLNIYIGRTSNPKGMIATTSHNKTWNNKTGNNNNNNHPDDSFDFEDAIQHAMETNNVSTVKFLSCWRMVIAYDFGDYELAGEMLENISECRKKGAHFECSAGYTYMRRTEILTFLELARRHFKEKYVQKAKKIAKIFKIFSKKNPHSCLSMYYLIEAELASTNLFLLKCKKKNHKINIDSHPLAEEAYNKYVSSISIAGTEGMLYDQAVAIERFAYHLYRSGHASKALRNFNKASCLYGEWGANRKVEYIQKEVQKLFDATGSSTTSISTATVTTVTTTSAGVGVGKSYRKQNNEKRNQKTSQRDPFVKRNFFFETFIAKRQTII